MQRKEEEMTKLKGLHHKKLESVQLDVSSRLSQQWCVCVCVRVCLCVRVHACVCLPS